MTGNANDTNNEDNLPKMWAENRVWRYAVYFVESSGVYVTLMGYQFDDGRFNCGFHIGASGFDLDVLNPKSGSPVAGRVITVWKGHWYRGLQVNLGQFMRLRIDLVW